MIGSNLSENASGYYTAFDKNLGINIPKQESLCPRLVTPWDEFIKEVISEIHYNFFKYDIESSHLVRLILNVN